jgi:glycosyltransferase
MKFTIITVCLNAEKTIADTLTSVANQSYQDYEHVVFDGGSTDDTRSIVERFASERVKLIDGSDAGIYDALNQSISYATGEIINFLNADDFYHDSEVLSTVLQAKCDTRAKIFYGNVYFVSNDKNKTIQRIWRTGKITLKNINFGVMAPTPSVFYSYDLIAHEMVFDTRYNISGDYDLFLKLKNEFASGVYVDKYFVGMRLGGASNGSLKSIILKWREDYAIMKKHTIFPFMMLICKNIVKLGQLVNTHEKNRLQ